MELDTYQELALRTENPNLTSSEKLTNGAMGLAGEAGEAVDLVKKHLFHKHPLDKERLKKELGDVLWYLAALANGAGLSLNEVAEGNIQKLKARYPEGFDELRSIHREGE